MSTLTLKGLTSGSSVLKAPDSGSNEVTFTMPASTGTLLTTDGDGSSLTGLSSFDPDGAVTINESSADVDFRVEGDNKVNALFVQGSNSYVGIGSGAPVRPLTIDTQTGTTSLGGTAEVIKIAGCNADETYCGIGFHYDNSDSQTHSPAFMGYQAKNWAGSTKGDLVFGTRSVTSDTAPIEKMRISSGNDIYFKSDTAGMAINYNTSSGSSEGTLLHYYSTDHSGGNQLVASIIVRQGTGDGNSRKAEIVWAVSDNGPPSTAMTLFNNGTISGDFNDTSDVNLKENIVDMGSATSTIKALKPRIFDWKKESKASSVAGFIAQEVAETIPTAVSGDEFIEQTFYTEEDDIPDGSVVGDEKEQGNMGKAINTTSILAYAVKTIQELEARIETLEAN